LSAGPLGAGILPTRSLRGHGSSRVGSPRSRKAALGRGFRSRPEPDTQSGLHRAPIRARSSCPSCSSRLRESRRSRRNIG